MSAPTLVKPVDPAWPLLTAVRTCAAAQLGYYRRPVVTFPVVFGDRPPPADNCACKKPDGTAGSAWVRIVPQRLANVDLRFTGTGCETGRWQHDLEIGVYRCWPTTSNAQSGAAPTEQQYTNAAKGLYQDAAALRAVLRCCEWLTSKDLAPTQANVAAVGPSGGCVAVVLTATYQLDECQCPTAPIDPSPSPPGYHRRSGR